MRYCWAEAKARLETFEGKYNKLGSDMNLKQPKMKANEEKTNTLNMQQAQRQIRANEKIAASFRELEEATPSAIEAEQKEEETGV